MLTSLSQQLAWLEQWMQQAERSLRHQPTGLLVVQSGHPSPQYYVKASSSDHHGRYISRKDIEYIKALAQKGYDDRFLQTARKQASLLLRLQKQGAERSAYPLFQTLSGVYTSLSLPRRALVQPYVLPDDLFVRQWLDRSYQKTVFSPEDPLILTERGEQVRSKSEKIIADKLFMLHVPYLYDFPGRIQCAGPVNTDFLILDLKERTDIRLEHYGMMENQKYLLRALTKNEGYQRTGYALGDQYLCTFESDNHILDMRHFDAMIRQRLDLSLYQSLDF